MKRSKIIALIVVVMLITVLIPSFMDSINLFGSRANAEDATYSESDSGSGTGGGTTPTTTDNSLLVLEIVPYVGMGEIGYLIGGQEPINEARMSKDTAAGKLSFLGGAITAYDSYSEKKLPASGSAESGYTYFHSYSDQNGYFQYVGPNNGGTYQKVANDNVYNYVGNGMGSYSASLKSEITDIYTSTYGADNYKNVNAYFVYGKPAGTPLYSTSVAYAPSSVTRNTSHTGDYDFNSDTNAFTLDKGHGDYDVLFSRNISGTNQYYMTNDYSIVQNGTGHYSWNLNYTNVGIGKGSYNFNPYKFNYKTGDPYNYTYKWIPYTGTWTMGNYTIEGTEGSTSEKVWIKGQTIQIDKEYTFKVTLVNHEWFKRLTMGLSSDQCKNVNVNVVTMTPQQLNLPENQHYLKDAGIIYINSNYSHNQAYIDLYESYNDIGITLSTSQKFEALKNGGKLNFAVNDLSWSSTLLLFNRIAGVRSDGSLGGYRAGVIFDDTFYQNAVSGNGDYSSYSANVTVDFSWNAKGASVCNLAKLYIMVYQRDSVKFYNTFLSPTAPLHITQVNSSDNSTGTTGSFIRPGSGATANSTEATFWNGNTFCPYCLDSSGSLITPDINTTPGKDIIKKEIPNFNITADTTDMMANVLVLNGMDIFTSKFVEPLKMPDDVLPQAQIALGSTATSFSLFAYINITSDGGTGYGPGRNDTGTSGAGEDGTSGSNLRSYISVLNIEPTADFAASQTSIKTILDGYPIKITNMTSVQFNSSILDVNTHYDVIYMGTGSGRFNTNGSGTDFNTDSLDGKIYHTGDTIATSLGAKNYAGNDLTTEKINELKNFLNAGYPILLEDDIYSLSKVMGNTGLSSFISTMKTKALNNFLNTKGFFKKAGQSDTDYITAYTPLMSKLRAALNIARPQIRIIEPILSDGSTVNYAYVNPATNLLRIEFAVIPNGLAADRSIYYGANLYMDYNEDGIFSPDEELTVSSMDGTSATGFNESFSTTHIYQYDMSNHTGVFQWKVEVTRLTPNSSGGGYTMTPIRSEINGYAACYGHKTIYALQITDNPDTDTTTYSLEDAVKNSSSLIKKYAVDQMVGEYDIVFKTMSVNQFAALYTAKPYTTATAATTNELAGYHLMILDNQSDAIPNTNGALTNIKDEVSKGMGLLYTGGSVSYANQSNYQDKPIFENRKTYSYLSRMANSSTNKYIYNFSAGGYDYSQLSTDTPYHTTIATKTNEGSDCEYPYLIGDSINIADTLYTQDTTVDYYLDSDVHNNPPLIGWYSLSDTKASTYQGIYSSSPDDVKNNYYLFNRGTSYYSGIQLKKADTTGKDSEIKLFINTIIATYKSSKRTIKAAPVITITSPIAHSNTITYVKTDVEGHAQVPITFTITESSSNMNVSVTWDDISKTTDDPTVTTGNWNKQLYRLNSDGTETLLTNLTNLGNGTYTLKVSSTDLKGEHTLSITALNADAKSTTLNTLVRYIVDPPTVTITNSDLVINVDKHEQYLYSDIDYAAGDQEDDYLGGRNKIRLEFTVGNTSNNVSVIITDNTGASISYVDTTIHKADGSAAYQLGQKVVPPGSYYVDVSPRIMNQVSNFDITITANDDSLSGSSTVTLLRRSLFQLD